ncbi:MAG: hypothetical protein MUC69_08615 [Gemmatimonadales bacterium]|jgi:hypothetical protein|nr:hypothetical protein [Gemmatimonadales bacterium]
MRALLLLLLGVVAVLLAAVLVARRRWRAESGEVAASLARLQGAPGTVSFAELDGTPAPVARYLRAVLREGQPIVRHARLAQSGDFLLDAAKERWVPFDATQHIVPAAPGFVWDAAMRMAPGVDALVRDAFVAGTGAMQASALGLKTIVDQRGTPAIAQGALYRYLAEAVWVPTALLPSQGVRWTPIDERRALARLEVATVRAEVEYRFGSDGLVEAVYAPDRMRDVNGTGVPTPWEGHWSEYGERGGMRIPLRGEVGWMLPEGLQLYWKGRVTHVAYD